MRTAKQPSDFARAAIVAALAIVATCITSPAHASAQTTSQTPLPQNPDLSIDARVTARELKFKVVPNPKVEFTGRPRRETVWEADRQNLPQAVRPGETYRDIGITLRIRSIFPDIERIVAEALGETPLTDDVPADQQTTPPQQPPSQTPSATPAPTTPEPQTSPTASAPQAQSRATRRAHARRGTRR